MGSSHMQSWTNRFSTGAEREAQTNSQETRPGDCKKNISSQLDQKAAARMERDNERTQSLQDWWDRQEIGRVWLRIPAIFHGSLHNAQWPREVLAEVVARFVASGQSKPSAVQSW